MRIIPLALSLSMALALAACGDEAEPVEGAVTTTTGEVVTEAEADVLEGRTDALEQALPPATEDVVAVEERADVLEQQTDAVEETVTD